MAETRDETELRAAEAAPTVVRGPDPAILSRVHLRRLRPAARASGATLDAALDRLERLFALVRARWASGVDTDLGPDEEAVEWFLDNAFVVQDAVGRVRDDLPRSYYRQLPLLSGAAGPRASEVAAGYLAAEGYHATADTLVAFLDAYQADAPLSLGEVWALPSLLRLELLRAMASALASLSGEPVDEPADEALHEPVAEPVDGRPGASEAHRPPQGIGRGDLVARAITSLATLAALDWESIAEHISVVHATLASGDPDGVYARMDFHSRDRYRRAVEAVARGSASDEPAVARAAVELAAARPAGDRSHHVGFFLVDDGRAELERRVDASAPVGVRLRRALTAHATGAYLGAVAAAALALVALAAYAARGAAWATVLAVALAIVPALTAAVAFVNWAVTRVLPPRVLPKLDFREGIPAAHACLVVVPALVARRSDVDALLRQLQRHHARNPDPALGFVVLSDFADAPQESMAEDADLLAYAADAVDALNRATPGAPFLFLHRRRVFNPGEGCWMGWERKRGKLHEFNRLLQGATDTSYEVFAGDTARLDGVSFVITLDADTVLPPDAARRLVGALAHPLNRPVADPRTGRTIAGYTVLQPRAEIAPESAGASRYARVFAGDATVDLYSRAVSDAYHDLFGAGIYVGKGIYDVAAFERALDGRVPENALLSHDLFEGIHGRVGLLTDVTVYEDYPPNHLVGLLRTHRWLRGDWQLLPWLASRTPRAAGRAPNDLPVQDRWKILDNLRRSLRAPAIVALLLAAWLGLPGSPAFWTPYALLTPLGQVAGAAAGLAAALARAPFGRDRRDAWRPRWASLRTIAARTVLSAAGLMIDAGVAVDAIRRTCWRLAVSRRHLLEWTTAAAATHLIGENVTLRTALRGTAPSVVATVAAGALVAVARPAGLAPAAAFLALWLAAPWLVVWLSRPPAPRARAALTDAQRGAFAALARRTWLFFETHVGPDDNWLPPDNVQEVPLGVVAHRTSPTNVGLYLVSCLAAHDRGYLGTPGLASRLALALDALDRVERYRGHLPNWIDTTTLASLRPAYVSTVDSGNLAACQVILAQGCAEALDEPVPAPASWAGLLDAVALVREGLPRHPSDASAALAAYLDDLATRAAPATRPDGALALEPDPGALAAEANHRFPALLTALAEAVDAPDLETLTTLRAHASVVQRHLESLHRDEAAYLPWRPALRAAPARPATASGPLAQAWSALEAAATAASTWRELPARCDQVVDLATAILDAAGGGPDPQETRAWASGLVDAASAAGRHAAALGTQLASLAARARAEVDALDLGFLYNRTRGLFHIGYNLDNGTLDGSFYDLLASESRLASLVAIGRHQVPQDHWLHLGRPTTRTPAGDRVLLSWSGTMFEYLLPTLLTETPPASLLGRTCAAAVATQIAYRRGRRNVWGVSESGFYAFDAHQLYQYRAFGIPALALQRRTGDDDVIAPYASLMAAAFAPDAVAANLARLREAGAIGRLGAYEALDYTPSRVPLGRDVGLVRSHMSHHQGMALLGLVQALDGPTMVRRFHAEPFTAAVTLLLHESVPAQPHLAAAAVEEEEATMTPVARPVTPWRSPPGTDEPGVHWLTNENYRVLVTDLGGGASYRGATELTRWRADASLQDWGTWLYLQDLDADALWSATPRPLGAAGAEPAIFYPAHVEFRASHLGVRTDLLVAVAPEDAVEVRRLEVVNETDRPRLLAITGFAEVVLTDPATSLRHPAFGKLFVEAEELAGDPAGLVFHRRPQAPAETPEAIAVTLVADAAGGDDGVPTWGDVRRTADRRAFLGRLRTVSSPAALDPDGWWARPGEPVGRAPLDPAAAVGRTLRLPPHGRARLAWVMAAADTPGAAAALVEGYRSWAHLEHAFNSAATHADRELRGLGFAADDLGHAQRLLSLLTFPDPRLAGEAPAGATAAPALPSLWGMGISGDLPLVVAQLAGTNDLTLAQDLLRAHRYWRRHGPPVDLALVDRQASSYAEGLGRPLRRLLARWGAEPALNARGGGVFLLAADRLGDSGLAALHHAARAVFRPGRGGLGERLARLPEIPPPLPPFRHERAPAEPPPPVSPADAPTGPFANGIGAFADDGRAYLIETGPGRRTPDPWSNVIATPDVGFLCTESGLGATWVGNSGENRLTPWRNDVLTDLPAEAAYVRDEQTGEIWTPTPLPAGPDARFLTSHGAGFSAYRHTSHALEQELRASAVGDAPAKTVRLSLRNLADRPRRLTVTYYAEWVLGMHRDLTGAAIVTDVDAGTSALLARNPLHPQRPDAVAFLVSDRAPHGWTTGRREFLGRPGSLARPEALVRIGPVRVVGAGQDPCAALQVHLDLAPGAAEDVTFYLGQAEGRAAALDLAARLRDGGVPDATDAWDDLLGSVQINTPDPALDLMINRWLPYQTVACRMWGRTGYHQSSGAFGFRDQLQDSLLLLWSRPDLTREHLLRAAAHQFGEGDVLHWWHEPSRGVRTRISDDLLWLPYAVARYVESTGDHGVLDERAPFLAGPPLRPEEDERYDTWTTSDEDADLLEHCRRAVARGVTSGEHGLPLMGTGDWNDGMNRVGAAGRGESVWLAWFATAVLNDLAALEELRGRDGAAHRARAAEIVRAVEEHAWDGAWYLRAFDDSGTPIGSAGSAECRIDSIAQSWAVLAGAPVTDRTRRALRSTREHLVDADRGLALLFTPPFDRAGDPGYVKAYLPGVRENGGQYTHAAAWLGWALAASGDGTRAAALLDLLNPVRHTADPDAVARYRVEPYVLAADVYAGDHPGVGGWTWYTGSSAWFWRCAVEGLLGMTWHGDRLAVDPRLPDGWSGFTATVGRGGVRLRVTVTRNPDGSPAVRIEPEPPPAGGTPPRISR